MNDTTQYDGKINDVFANINKTPITTGLLRDYGIDFLNLDNYLETKQYQTTILLPTEQRKQTIYYPILK